MNSVRPFQTKLMGVDQISQFRPNFTILEYLEYLELGQFRNFSFIIGAQAHGSYWGRESWERAGRGCECRGDQDWEAGGKLGHLDHHLEHHQQLAQHEQEGLGEHHHQNVGAWNTNYCLPDQETRSQGDTSPSPNTSWHHSPEKVLALNNDEAQKERKPDSASKLKKKIKFAFKNKSSLRKMRVGVPIKYWSWCTLSRSQMEVWKLLIISTMWRRWRSPAAGGGTRPRSSELEDNWKDFLGCKIILDPSTKSLRRSQILNCHERDSRRSSSIPLSHFLSQFFENHKRSNCVFRAGQVPRNCQKLTRCLASLILKKRRWQFWQFWNSILTNLFEGAGTSKSSRQLARARRSVFTNGQGQFKAFTIQEMFSMLEIDTGKRYKDPLNIQCNVFQVLSAAARELKWGQSCLCPDLQIHPIPSKVSSSSLTSSAIHIILITFTIMIFHISYLHFFYLMVYFSSIDLVWIDWLTRYGCLHNDPVCGKRSK